MTTTDPGADKADFLLGLIDRYCSGDVTRSNLEAQIRAALTHRQQGVVGQAEVLQTLLDIWHGGHLTVRPEAAGHWNAAVEAGEAMLGRLDQLAALISAPPAQPQSEPMAMDLLRTDFKRECDDTNMILRMLGLEPENCRTDGGSLKTGMILNALEARDRLLQRLALAAQPPERAAQQKAQKVVTGRFSSADRLIKSLRAERVYIVPTGEVHEGHETFTRHDSPPPLADFETLYASPPRAVEPMPALTDEQIEEIACTVQPITRTGHPSWEHAVIRAYEAARGIGKQGQG